MVGYIPLVCMVKFKLLSEFPVYNLPHQIMCRLLLFCANLPHSLIIYSFRVFHISVTWWFFTGVWVTLSLLKSPGLLSGFWPFSAMLLFGYSRPVRQLPSPPGLLIITIGTIVTFVFHCFFNSLARSRYLSFFCEFFTTALACGFS